VPLGRGEKSGRRSRRAGSLGQRARRPAGVMRAAGVCGAGEHCFAEWREQMRDHLAKVESEVASESVCSLVPIVWPLMGAIYERVANLWSGQLELGLRARSEGGAPSIRSLRTE
jgi:hypothetical protein